MTPNELTPDLAAFIEAQTSIFLATASANGQPHIQHRGPPRFLRVLDDETPGTETAVRRDLDRAFGAGASCHC